MKYIYALIHLTMFYIFN